MSEWKPISEAPVGREMFVAKGFAVCNGHTGGKPYATDPWCVWQESPGEFTRWPHHFPPTHFMPLPPPPEPTPPEGIHGCTFTAAPGIGFVVGEEPTP